MESAICLIVTVVVFHNIYDKETETLTYGWYIAVLSLGFVTLACPCYIVDGCQTIKNRNKKASTAKIAPCPTALTVNERQLLIDGFINQMSKQKSQLPEPLGLKCKFSVLYDGTNIEHPPPGPIIPVGRADDTYELTKMENLKQPMVIPPSCDDNFKTIYDDDDNEENFVHPPPKIVSSDTPFQDILLRNLQTYSDYDSDISRKSSCYSLESGQIDDCDPGPIILVGRDDDTNELMKMETLKQPMVIPPSCDENFKTIYDDDDNEEREEVLKPSEAENDDDTEYKANNKSASTCSSRRHKPKHDNEAYAKSNDVIYRAKYGASSPYTEKQDIQGEKGKYDDKRQKPRKQSSKRKKYNRNGTKRKKGDIPLSRKDLNTTKEEISNEATVKGAVGYCNGGKSAQDCRKKIHGEKSDEQVIGK
ncbi:unnamed protein product [Mytilus coruscus]|uniref:Uncharacterized protein n=1 Tax=Mytilus coruscus TaxID=42192 RepID=A0A6J8CT41_MYTCO|nr:unnamed protein product [Mytilus coruscus]